MSVPLAIVPLLVGSYLLGSVPFGLWVTKAWSGVDIREVGSGNIGTTNVLRAAGWRAALVVFALDAGKGAGPVLAAKALAAHGGYAGAGATAIILAAGATALVGHTFSAFLGLRGGRGVATGFGVLAGLSWPVGLSGLGVFVVLLLATRIVSLSSMAGAFSMWVFMLAYHQGRTYTVFAAAAAVLVMAQHAPNIRRLLRGEEPRVGRREKRPAQQAGAANE
jgi:glycerol-3-phosphate acyltransferase PlsY